MHVYGFVLGYILDVVTAAYIDLICEHLASLTADLQALCSDANII
jgi:hypothetical protein